MVSVAPSSAVVHRAPSPFSRRPVPRSELVRARDGHLDRRGCGCRAAVPGRGAAGRLHGGVGAVRADAGRPPRGACPALGAPPRPGPRPAPRPGHGALLRLSADGAAVGRRRRTDRGPRGDRAAGSGGSRHRAVHGRYGDGAHGGRRRAVPHGGRAPQRAARGGPRVAASGGRTHGVGRARAPADPASGEWAGAKDAAAGLTGDVRAQPAGDAGAAARDLRPAAQLRARCRSRSRRRCSWCSARSDSPPRPPPSSPPRRPERWRRRTRRGSRCSGCSTACR